MNSPHASAPAVDLGKACLFLDVDGTIVDLAAVPGDARAVPALVAHLAELRRRLDGALCLVSGRPIAQLDGLFQPLRLPCAGVHGLERRSADGALQRATIPVTLLDAASSELNRLINGRSGLLLEIKPGALALHYRRVPEAADFVRLVLGRLVSRYAPQLGCIDGDKVMELVPAGCGKGAAVEAFMAEPPFAGRQPVYVGDDTTDAAALEAARRHHGIDVAVGDRVSARWRMDSPADVRQWLARLAGAQDDRH
jgi:trehalose 6-phosphate phosphatase